MLSLVSLPLAIAGVAVGGFHVYLESVGKLECPSGLLGLGSSPLQALVIQAALAAVLAIGVTSACRTGEARLAAMAGAIVLGALLAAGAVVSAPPMPGAPEAPYKQAPDICRPPYRAP
jgi:hypothetical protein